MIQRLDLYLKQTDDELHILTERKRGCGDNPPMDLTANANWTDPCIYSPYVALNAEEFIGSDVIVVESEA